MKTNKMNYAVFVIAALQILNKHVSVSTDSFEITESSIQTPGYPGLYPSNIYISHEVPIPAQQTMKLTFVSFNVEQEIECRFDYLSIEDESGQSVGPNRLCGPALPGPFLITGSAVKFQFYSDSGIAGTGFRAVWTFEGQSNMAVDGNFSSWSTWSNCSVCVVMNQTRSRTCTSPPPANGGADCLGPSIEIRQCSMVNCSVNGSFSEWGNWSECSQTCGIGGQIRSRSCMNPPPVGGGADCVGNSNETRDCNTGVLCPVNGSFSEWGNWSECSETCGNGKQIRSRSCTNPTPVGGGAGCVGNSNETRDCNTGVLCPVNGSFSEWGNWSECSETCGNGKQIRSRSCTNPTPVGGGAGCVGNSNETRDCNTGVLCPGWNHWGNWTIFKNTCSKKIFQRSRNCTSSSSDERNGNCSGPTMETNECYYYGYCPGDDSCCILNEVRIINLGKNISKPTTIFKSTTFTVHGLVGDFCPVANGNLLEWRITDLNSVDNATTFVSHGEVDWTMTKQIFDVGLYMIELRLTSLDFRNMSSTAYGYLKITPSRLVARISGGAFVLQGYDIAFFTLNASQSYDPDVGKGNYTDMSFTWLCKKPNETYPPHAHYPSTNMSVVNFGISNKSKDLGGCFGTGIGKLNSTGRLIKLQTSLLEVGETYDFTLVVSKDRRVSSFAQSVKVVEGVPLRYEIRCFSNCGSKMNPSSRLRLKTFCNGTCDYSVKHLWKLFEILAWEEGKAVTKEANYLQENTLSKLENKNLVIKENSLLSNQDYRISVEIDFNGFGQAVAVYDFTTNAPPSGGQCTVDPLLGEVLVTNFQFTCYGWLDDDMPILFKIYYKIDDVFYTLSSYGRQHSYSIKLTQGKASENFTISTKVDIVDSLGAVSSVFFDVQVLPPVQNQQLKASLKELTVGETSQVRSLAAMGDVEGTTELAHAALSSMEQVQPSAEVTTEDKTEVKKSIIVAMASIKPKTIDAVSQITAVLRKATEKPEEVSLTSQKKIVEIVDTMTAVLANDTVISVETLASFGSESLIKTVANVINAASRTAKQADAKSFSSIVINESQAIQESKDIVVTAVAQVGDIGRILLARKVAGEPSTVIKTSLMSMVLNRQRPAALNGSKIEIGNHSILLPPVEELLRSHSRGVDFLDAQMITLPFNAYSWDSRTDIMSPNIVSLQLKDDIGNPVIVKDLKTNLIIAIPQASGPKDKPLKDETFFVRESKEGKMKYHYVLRDLERTSITIKIDIEPGIQVAAFVKYNKRPTVDSYDYRTTLPDFSSCVQDSSGQYVGCERDPRTAFIPGSILSQTGKYYIGVQHIRNSNTTKLSRKKRSCVHSKKQKRSCVETKEAPTMAFQAIRLNDSTVLVYDPSKDTNYTITTWQSSCLYWSVEEQRWMTKGCEASPDSDEKKIHCLCDHLTTFGGAFFVSPNPIDFDKVLVSFMNFDRDGSIAVLATIVALLVLYVAVVIIAIKADRADEEKIGPPLSFNFDAESTRQYEMIINTGVWKHSGTTANVHIVVHGNESMSSPIVLHRSIAKGRVILARGNSDKLYFNSKKKLGTLKRLQIWHDNSGSHPSWFLSSVTIRDVDEDHATLFICNRWFALERDDGKITRSILPTSEKKLKSFKTKLDSRKSENFADNHLWLSVITKAPKSTFTRAQRATCCLTLLFSAMIANAMFYRLDKIADQSIQVGPLKFSARQVAVGVQSCLIVTPINLFIVWIFRNSEPTRTKEEIEGDEHGNARNSSKQSTNLRGSHSSVKEIHVFKKMKEANTLEKCNSREMIIKDHNQNILPRSQNSNTTSNNYITCEDSFFLPSASSSSTFNTLDFKSSIEKSIGDEYFVKENYPENEDISEEQSEMLRKLYSCKNRRQLRSMVELELGGDFDSRHYFDAVSDKDKHETLRSKNNHTDSSKQLEATDIRDLEDINLQIQDSAEFDSEAREHEHKHKELETGYSLPYWCIWIAWFLCFVVIVISASFTFFYSLMWGKDIANQWLSSMFVSFMQELFLNQPIKMFGLMVVLAFILKKPADEVSPGWKSTVKGRCNITTSSIRTEVKIVMPDEEELNKLRDYRAKRRKMFNIAREVVTYAVFLFLLMTVCYGNRSKYGFLITQDIKNTFSEFNKIGDSHEFFAWLNESLIQGLFSGKWYNGAKEPVEAYIGNKQSLLVGMPRLRQLRVQEGSCDVPDLAKRITTRCYDFYSIKKEDKIPYSLPGWKKVNSTLHTSPTDICPKPWRYESQENLDGLPSWGYFSIYSGGGYIANLGYNHITATDILKSLFGYKWIDRKSRAIIVEFSVFNSNSNYISISTFFYEILPNGYRNSFQKIESIALYRTDSALFELWLVCQFLFMGLVVYYLALELYNIWKQRCRYFRQLWNWIDMAQIVTALLAIVFYMIKEKTILEPVLKIKSNPYENVSFYKAIQWADAENVLLSFAVFVGTTKLLKLVRLNFQINVMLSSTSVRKEALLSYMVFLFCIISAFSQAGYLIFGSTVEGYSTFIRALSSEMELTLGGTTNLDEMQNVHCFLGPLFVFSFVTTMAFVFVNVFVAVLNESYRDVRQHPDLLSKEYEIGKLIKDRVTGFFFTKDHSHRDASNRRIQEKRLLTESYSNNLTENPALYAHKNKDYRLYKQLQLLEYLLEKLDKKVEQYYILEETETFLDLLERL